MVTRSRNETEGVVDGEGPAGWAGRRWRRRHLAGLAGAAGLAGWLTGGLLGSRVAVAQSTLVATPAASPTGATKVITTAYGEATIPIPPTRVLVMENRADLEVATALQLPVAGVGVYIGAFGTEDDYVNSWVPFVPGPDVVVLNTAEPDLEAVMLIKPDLIISREVYLDGTFGFGYEGLSHVAPVIPLIPALLPDGREDWRSDLEQTAAYLELEPLLDEVFAEFDAEVAAIKARHGATIVETSIAVLRYLPDAGEMFVNPSSLFIKALEELGGTVYPIETDDSGSFSIEQVNQLAGADAILLWGEEYEFAEIATNPLWTTLPAVQAGRVFHGSTMTNYGSIYAMRENLRIFDEFFATLD